MEVVLRALNEYDILCNPLINGIVSKKRLYFYTKRYLESKEAKYLASLSPKEQEEYIKSYIPKYLKTHKGILAKRFFADHKNIRTIINKYVTEQDSESYYWLLQFLSTLNNHLINGSRTYTEWISTTTCFDSMYKYYQNQDVHNVAVCQIPTNGIYNRETLAVDLSDREKIKQIKCLSKKINATDVHRFIELVNKDPELEKYADSLFHEFIFQETNEKFMGFNFATASREICIYDYIPPQWIYSVLERIHIDLILIQRFNEEYISLSKEDQKKELIDLRERMKQLVLRLKDSYAVYVFEQLYLENKNKEKIATTENERAKIEHYRRLILANTIEYIPSTIIKK